MAIQDIFDAILAFDDAKVRELTQSEIEAGTNVNAILNDGLIAAMDDVGRKFSEGDMFVPEMLRSALAMKRGLEVLKPYLTDGDAASKGAVVIGTVKGDLHDIGKNLIVMMMEGAGFNVLDLGVDVEAERFVQAARDHQAGVVALSALLTTTMPAMQTTITALKGAALGVHIIVGGAPVTDNFAREIGADGYGHDAPSAVELARKFMATKVTGASTPQDHYSRSAA